MKIKNVNYQPFLLCIGGGKEKFKQRDSLQVILARIAANT